MSRISALKDIKYYCDSKGLTKFTNLTYFHSVFTMQIDLEMHHSRCYTHRQDELFLLPGSLWWHFEING